MSHPVPSGLAVYDRAADDDAEAGPMIVLVHGTMDRGASFIKVQKRLRHRHVVRYDRRGYARSRAVDPAGGLRAHTDDLLAIVGGGPAVVVGHSFGGLVALAAAERSSDEILAVGCFEAPMGWAGWWPMHRRLPTEPDPAAVAEGFMRRLLGDQRWAALPDRTRADRRAEGVAVVGEIRSIEAGQPPFDLGAIEVPVVCGYGTSSPAHLQRAAVEMASMLHHGVAVSIEGAGHDAHVSHPDGFTSLVEDVVRAAASSTRSIR